MSSADRQALQEQMRSRYATHYTDLAGQESEAEVEEPPADDIDPNEPTPYW